MDGMAFFPGELSQPAWSLLLLGAADPAGTAIRMALLAAVGVALVRVWAASQRPDTNRKCALSLLFVLQAAGAMLFLEALRFFFLPRQAPDRLDTLAGLGFAGALVAAFVIGMLGLLERQDRRRKTQRGGGMGLGGCASSAVLLTLLLAVGPANLLSLPTLLQPLPPGGPAGAPIEMPDLNFRFAPPGSPWKRADADPDTTSTTLRFARPEPGFLLEVGAEKFGAGFDTDQWAEVRRAKVRKRFDSEHALSVRAETLNRLAGLRTESRATKGHADLFIIQWHCFRNGFGYHLRAEGPWARRKSLLAEANRYFAGFEMLDPDRFTDEAGKAFESDFTSRHYGYRVAVTGSAWKQWPGLQREFSWLEFAARKESGAYMAVLPVWFGQDLDEEAMLSAMLRVMNIRYPDQELTHRERLSIAGRMGVQFDYQRRIAGVPTRYRLRLLHANGFAWLIAGWQAATQPDFPSAMVEALDRVTFPEPAPTPPDLSSLSAPEKAARGLMLNEAGGYYFERKEFGRARDLFLAAHAASPNAVYVRNTLSAWASLNDPAPALAFIETQQPEVQNSVLLRSFRALFQRQSGDLAGAADTYATLLAEGTRNPEWLEDYIGILMRLQRHQTALEVLQRQRTSADHPPRMLLLEAALYRDLKQPARAVEILRSARETAPFVPEIGRALASTLLETGDFAAALKVCQELAAQSQPDLALLTLRGRCEAELGRFAEAKVSFEQALRLDPGNPDLARSLERLAGALGEGSTRGATREIAPVLIPPELFKDPDEPAPEQEAREFGAFYTVRITALEIADDGSRRETDFGRVRILDAAGVAAFSTVSIPFDPLLEDIALNQVRVRDATGQDLAVPSPKPYVADDTGSEMVTHRKLLHVPIGGLHPGAVLEFMVTRRTGPTADASPFLEYTFSRPFPIQRSVVFLAGTGPNLQARSRPPLEERKLPTGSYWLRQNPPLARPEPLQPPAADYLPMLWFGRTTPQWETLALRYLTTISDRLSLNDELRDLARNLTRDLPPDARLVALARQVQTNYTYKALEFGRRGRIPEIPALMARNRYGDCKDHSVMLQQLLLAAGIPAHLALINTAADLVRDLPSLEQFDHMIVYVPGPGTAQFIDTTHKGAWPARVPPPGLEGREALVLDPQNPRFTLVPPAPEPSRFASERHVTITNLQDAVVEEILTLSGSEAAHLRDALINLPAANRQRFAQRHLGTSGADLAAWAIHDLENPSQPLRIRLTYVLRQAFHQADGRLTGSVPALTERFYLSQEAVERRRSPFQIRDPRWFASTLRIQPPKGFTPQPPEATTSFNSDSEYLSVQTGQRTAADAERTLDFRQKLGQFPPERYAAFREETAKACAFLEQPVTFRPESP